MITTCLTGNLGNHMWYYTICRLVAEKLEYEWGISPKTMYDYFHGMNQMYFMDVDFGKEVNMIGRDEDGLGMFEEIINRYSDKNKQHTYNGDSCLINMYDPNVFNISDNTMVHMVSQSEDYLIDRREDILNWFRIKDECESSYKIELEQLGIILDDNTCVINFRGGEFNSVPNLIPSQNYWINSINHMKGINPNMKFIIISDDPQCANHFIPDIKCYHIDIGFDFYVVNRARYLILPNSTFSWWSAWLNQYSKLTIAPKYWGRYNVSNGYWSLGDSYTRRFVYMNREGKIDDYESCKEQALDFYKKNNLI